MKQWFIEYQASRLVFFALTFMALAWWETRAAWRPWLTYRLLRWRRHFGLAVISQLCVRIVFPMLAVGAAITVKQNNIGIFNQYHVPYIIAFIVGMIALDFVIYLQHRLLHRYGFLWRLHRVHHMDKQVDVSTGLRFHPIEALFTTGAKIVGVGFFGVPPLAVFVYELLLNFATLFTHVNIVLPKRWEQRLRKVIVTPGMHRIHHSDFSYNTNSNYGFCLSIWDKFFSTYVPYPYTGERRMLFGLSEYRDPKFQTLENMLLVPFNVKHLKVWPRRPLRTKLKDTDNLPIQKIEAKSE